MVSNQLFVFHTKSLLVLLSVCVTLGSSQCLTTNFSKEHYQVFTNDLARRLQTLEKSFETMKTCWTCPTKEQPEIQKKEKVFVVFTEKKNWFEALADCLLKNMTLASIEKEEEYQQVSSQLNGIDTTSYMYFWLAGSDLGHEGHFVWMNTGRNVTWTKWWRTEKHLNPDNHTSRCPASDAGENCMELAKYDTLAMNDICCSKRQNYVCERWG